MAMRSAHKVIMGREKEDEDRHRSPPCDEARCEPVSGTGILAVRSQAPAGGVAQADQRHKAAQKTAYGRAWSVDRGAPPQAVGGCEHSDGLTPTSVGCREPEDYELHDRHVGRDAQPGRQTGEADGW